MNFDFSLKMYENIESSIKIFKARSMKFYSSNVHNILEICKTQIQILKLYMNYNFSKTEKLFNTQKLKS